MKQNYFVCFSAFGTCSMRHEKMSTSIEFWEELKSRAKSIGIDVDYKIEKVNDIDKVYYVIANYPAGGIEEYYLLTSKNTQEIINEIAKRKVKNERKRI